MADDREEQEKAFEREARRLERLRGLRLVELPPQDIFTTAEVDYEPEEAA